MANPEHVRWILEGPESWNKRQEENQFTPDLSGVNLYEVFQEAGKLDGEGKIPLQGIDLNRANLESLVARNANLVKADLTGARLKHANLGNSLMNRAKLVGAHLEDSALHDAILDYADLTFAHLQDAYLAKASLKKASIEYANAERVELEAADLEGASLSRINLERASLKSAKLTGAFLRYANLKDACLDKAELAKAYLFGADLTQTTFRDANLSGANLGNATLKNTDLQNANLTDAILERAELHNAYLTGTTPWKSVLFQQNNITAWQREDRLETVTSIEDLLSAIRKLQQLHSTATLYFRGEAKSQWVLRPSVMRSSVSMAEGSMLTDLISRRPEEFNSTNSALAQWVLAQHHGLRTRFLDITRNPLVALYYACKEEGVANGRLHVFAVPKSLVKPFNSDTITLIANFAKLSREQQDVILGKETCACHNPRRKFNSLDYQTALRQLYQLIGEERANFVERIDPRDLYRVFVVEPQQSPERIRAQSGAFLASAFHERFERDRVQRWNERIPVYAHYKLTLQGHHKPQIMDDLRLMNISQETLFPGLDTSAKAILDVHHQEEERNRREEVEWDMLSVGSSFSIPEVRHAENGSTRPAATIELFEGCA